MGEVHISWQESSTITPTQWIAACRTLIRYCPNLNALDILWQSIWHEAQRSAIPKMHSPASKPSGSNDTPIYPTVHKPKSVTNPH